MALKRVLFSLIVLSLRVGVSISFLVTHIKSHLQGSSIHGIRASSETIGTQARYAIDGNLSTYWAPEIILPERPNPNNIGTPHQK